jgi:hypothetical protein
MTPRGLLLRSALPLLLLSSCGPYSTTSQIAPYLKTVYVPTFQNKTSEFSLPQLLTDGINETLLSQGNLKISSTEEADAVLRGTILAYKVEALAYESGGSVTSRRVRILVDVEFVDQIKNKVLWKDERMERWGTFESSEAERDGAVRAIEKLATDIVTQALQGW